MGIKEQGMASWYGAYFHGLATASGEIFDMEAFTGAHRTLPLGTVVRVTNVLNGMQVRVRINDRGPYVNGRVLDLSLAAARQLGMVEHGVAAVHLEVIGHQGAGLLLPVDRGMVRGQSFSDSPRVSSTCRPAPDPSRSVGSTRGSSPAERHPAVAARPSCGGHPGRRTPGLCHGDPSSPLTLPSSSCFRFRRVDRLDRH